MEKGKDDTVFIGGDLNSWTELGEGYGRRRNRIMGEIQSTSS